jgi:isopentenyl diphosphate isomerase/L-lactate dehydrogenase-like FMN-dependent dehydrogenase
LFTAAAAAATGFAGAAFAQARPDRIDPGQPGGPPLPAMSRSGFPVVAIPTYGQALMDVINTHEFEPIAKKSISTYAYDYIRAGAGDDLTLQANLAAYDDFGEHWDHPIMLGPVGLRRLLHPDGDRLTILAAHQSKAVLIGPRLDLVPEITKQGTMPKWWGFALGHKTKQEARDWAKKNEDLGASAICIGMDYPYTGLRDIPSRDHWEGQWDNKPEFDDGDGTVTFQAAMIWPYFPNMNWEWFDWVKGITTGEDAKKALAGGVSAIAVSNHGGRTLDGANPTLRALPEVVDAVGGKVPVISDGGIRRGGDIIKAMALGAHAVTIGRPYLWALAGFGQEGVQRCIEMLQGELRIALGLSGTAVPSAIDRTLIREAWKPYTPHKPTKA